MTVPLLSDYLGKDKSTIYEQLLTLTAQNYVSKNYDSSYRLPAQPATYCLAARGIKYLRDTTEFSHTALRNQYKNRAASEQLVKQNLKTFQVCNQIRRQYPHQFDMYTTVELSNTDGFVRPLPDLYLQRNPESRTKPNSYVLELLEPQVPSWLLRQRIVAHGDVASKTEYQNPHVLFICTNTSTESRIQRLLENVMEDFEFWTTTLQRFGGDELNIWREVFHEDEDGTPIYRSL